MEVAGQHEGFHEVCSVRLQVIAPVATPLPNPYFTAVVPANLMLIIGSPNRLTSRAANLPTPYAETAEGGIARVLRAIKDFSRTSCDSLLS